MIVDVCTYNGEKDLWDLHYNVLKDHVDEFLVIEFTKTFSGKDKPIYITELDRSKYPKANFIVRDGSYEDFSSELHAMAEASPNTKGAAHWKLEFLQKESIKETLTAFKDKDTIFVGDVDEIWDPNCLPRLKEAFDIMPSHAKLKLKVYTYLLNNRSSEQFWGTLVAPYSLIKDNVLNHMRSDVNARTGTEWGWHFTSMGGYDEVYRKLGDSYTEESYWTEPVKDNLKHKMAQNKDFLGRNFTFTLDEKDWPQYLKDNKDKYIRLCR